MAVKVEIHSPVKDCKINFPKLMYQPSTDEVVLMHDECNGTIMMGNRVGIWFPNWTFDMLREWNGSVTITNKK